jgi:hypothetical protein
MFTLENKTLKLVESIQNVSVFTTAGSQILTVDNPSESVDLSVLSGMFIVKIISQDGNVYTSRIVVE